MKKILSFVIALAAIVCASSTAFASEQGDFYFMLAQIDNNMLFVNGLSTEFDADNPELKPVASEKGEALIPLRAVVTVAGGKVDWVEAENKVVIKYNGEDISFVLDSDEISVGEEKVKLSAAPYTIHDRTVVPLDFFSACMKGSSAFDKDTKTAMLGFETKEYAK